MTWRPSAQLRALEARAECLRLIRGFFDSRDVMEVETPILSMAGNPDPALDSLAVDSVIGGQPYYCNTSPEFAMKRLLAAGAPAIYQISRAFRAGETGRYHNPEFSLLEWYRPDFDDHQLMAEVEELLKRLLADRYMWEEAEYLTYSDALQQYVGFGLADVLADGGVQKLVLSAKQAGVDIQSVSHNEGVDFWLDLLFSHVIGPQLGHDRPCFVMDYPASQAALARLKPGQPVVAARFEVYFNGLELGNGYHELTDPAEQARRFALDVSARRRQERPPIPHDQRLIDALAEGLPDCSGIALGLDRVLMVQLGATHIDEVLAFPWGRA